MGRWFEPRKWKCSRVYEIADRSQSAGLAKVGKCTAADHALCHDGTYNSIFARIFYFAISHLSMIGTAPAPSRLIHQKLVKQ